MIYSIISELIKFERKTWFLNRDCSYLLSTIISGFHTLLEGGLKKGMVVPSDCSQALLGTFCTWYEMRIESFAVKDSSTSSCNTLAPNETVIFHFLWTEIPPFILTIYPGLRSLLILQDLIRSWKNLSKNLNKTSWQESWWESWPECWQDVLARTL